MINSQTNQNKLLKMGRKVKTVKFLFKMIVIIQMTIRRLEIQNKSQAKVKYPMILSQIQLMITSLQETRVML